MCNGNNGKIFICGGVIYGNNAETDLQNIASDGGATLSGSAQYGIFIGNTFYKSGDLTTTNNTIRILNGNLLTE